MATVEKGRQTHHADRNGLCGLCSETRDGRGGPGPSARRGAEEAGPGPPARRGAEEAGPGRQHGVMGCCVGPLLGGVGPPRGLLQLGGGKAVWRVSCEVYVSKYGKKCILNLFFVFNISA